MLKIIIATLLLLLVFTGASFSGIEDVHSYYLDKEYQKAAEEAINVLDNISSAKEAEEAYFYLGLSRMRLGSYKDARDDFRTIVDKFPGGAFLQRAFLATGDCFFLEDNYTKAAEVYKSFIETYPNSDILHLAYFRLGQTDLKLGNWQIAKNYLKQLKEKFPNSLEAKQSDELISREEFFTVQVAAFINQSSAQQLNDKLKNDGFEAYITAANTEDGKKIYRVRVGKLDKRYDAEALQAALALKDYPTRIYP
ncbi:MAG: tetratricopeptide repeat protein [Candidatus Omnitrophica bacterium]|nr:tetratricopeptide repeat protein [Candidatus Omnitrophota bacterium]HOX54333.1 tetratricopeptide repeat protein [Candidatus Omnitrophota bacterium]